jgi:hypothetical protein
MTTLQKLLDEEKSLAEIKQRIESREAEIKKVKDDLIQKEAFRLKEQLEQIQRGFVSLGYTMEYQLRSVDISDLDLNPQKKTRNMVTLEIMNLLEIKNRGQRPKQIFNSIAQKYWQDNLPTFQGDQPKEFRESNELKYFNKCLRFLSKKGLVNYFSETHSYSVN